MTVASDGVLVTATLDDVLMTDASDSVLGTVASDGALMTVASFSICSGIGPEGTRNNSMQRLMQIICITGQSMRYLCVVGQQLPNSRY